MLGFFKRSKGKGCAILKKSGQDIDDNATLNIMYLDAKIDDISWSQPYPKSGKPKKYLDVLLSKIPALSYKYFAQTWIAMFPPPRQKISSSHLTRVIWVSNILLPSFDTPYPNL